MAAIRSCDRASGKIPLSVILNEVEPEQLASAPQPTEDGGYRGHQASSHGSSPASSLGSPQPQHRGFNIQTPTEPRDPFGAYGKGNISAPEHRSRSRPWSDSNMPDRRPRPPRPSYSEEQKFFIMYARIIRDNTWPEIEDRFEKLFGTRTKGGLTSVYYRVRREWGLMEVLKSGPGSYAADCREVEQRAMNFSREFLSQIGYLPSVN